LALGVIDSSAPSVRRPHDATRDASASAALWKTRDSVSRTLTAKVWELTPEGVTQVHTLSARAGAITGVAFSPDGTHVMTRSETRVMDVWDVTPTGDAEVANVADAEELVSFTTRSIVTSGRDGSLTTLELGTGELSHRPIGWFEPPEELWSSYDFAPDGESIAVNHFGPPPTVRDVETGTELFAGSSWGFDWSPDGAFAAVNRHSSVVIVDRAGRRVGRFWHAPERNDRWDRR